MTVGELIKELSEYDLEMEVHCSVDCDPDGTLIAPEDHPRRVFGEDCMGVNPYHNQAVLLFNLESHTFESFDEKAVIKKCIARLRHLPAAQGSLKKMLKELP